MSQNQPSLLVASPIVGEDRTMEPAFRYFAQKVSEAVVIVGSGTPEAVVEAPQYSLYIDETVPTIPVQYRKMLADIGGDRTQGWIVV